MDKEEQHILQKHLVQFLVQDVFNTVSKNDLLNIVRSSRPDKADVWTHKGKDLPHAHVELLQTQAKSFRESELWKILKDELRWHAQEKGLFKSQTESDLIAAKVMLYIIEIVEQKLGDMSR